MYLNDTCVLHYGVLFPLRLYIICNVLVVVLCSTSLPGGNEVDGLPPVLHTGAAVVGVPGASRTSVIFKNYNSNVLIVYIMKFSFVTSHPNYFVLTSVSESMI